MVVVFLKFLETTADMKWAAAGALQLFIGFIALVSMGIVQSSTLSAKKVIHHQSKIKIIFPQGEETPRFRPICHFVTANLAY